MMDVTVKTLDGQNRNYSVPDNITVKQFKEKIANSINISADIQRLIFQGRVMQDEKQMKDYDVHGKVIHVVQRMPPSSTPRPSGGATNSSTPSTGGATGEQNLHSTLIGSFINLPSDVADPNQVHNIVQQAVNNMGDMGRSARVTTNASDDGSSVDVHIHLGQVPGARQSESQLRINQARRMLQMARENLDKLDRLRNPPAEGEQPQQTEGSQGNSASPMDVSESSQTQSSQQSEQTNTTEPSQSQASAQSETASQQAAPAPSQPDRQTTTRPEPQSTSASSNSQSNPSTESSSGQSANGSSSDSPRRGPVRPNISIVADVLEEVREVNNRLQPHMDTYQTIVREDRQLPQEETRQAQEVCNLVGEILHAISHCYHSLSDLMVDMGEHSPRQLYAAFVPAAIPAAVIQQTIPIHAQINVGGPQAAQRNMTTQSSVQTSSAATSTSQASTNASSQTQTTQASGQSTGTAPPTSASGATPVVTRASTDPYVFLEVGPDNAVTVNSITAHVISSEQEVPNTSGPSTGSTNTAPQGVHVQGHNVTQDLINNIVSSVMHAHTGPRIGPVISLDPNGLRVRRRSFPSSSANTAQTGSQTTSQSSNTSGTQTSSAANGASNTSGTQTSNAPTNSSGTQTGVRAPHAAAFVVPGMPGMMQRIPTAGPASVDPFLPCSSRHFLRHQARNNNNTPDAQGMNTGGIIGEFLNNLAGEVNPHLQGVHRQNAGRTGSSTGPATSQTANTSSSSTSSSSSSSNSTSSFSTTNTSGTGAGSMPFNPFAGLFGAMGGAPPPGINIRMPAGMAGMQGMQGMPGMPGMPPGMPFLPGLASMFGQAGPRPAGGNQNRTSSSTTSTSTTGTSQTTSTPTSGTEPAFVQQLRNLLQSGGMGSVPQPAPGTSRTGATPTPSGATSTGQGTSQGASTGATAGAGTNSGTDQPVMTDEAFTQLVQGIGSMITQTAVGQPPSQTLAEFLGSLGDGYNMAQGEGFFNDVYSCLSSHLTFPDLIQVFYGNRAPLQNVRVPLQNFLRERVLEGREPTMENITEASNRLVEEMAEEIEASANVAEVKPDIDLVETLNNFFRQQITSTVRMIMLADESNTNFGNQFYERMRLALAELIILTRSCFVEGQTSLQRVIQCRLSAITRGVNPMIQQWMCSVMIQQLNQFLPTITITDANVHSYVVKKSASKLAAKSAKKDEAATAMETSPPLVSPGASQVDSPEPMETQNINTGASVAQLPRPQPDTAAATKVPPTKVKAEEPKADSPGAAAGGQSWELEVNPDWVPIINSDIEKQKHQRPQPPLSDTYLQGMPAKRRKIMGHERQVNFSNAGESVPLSLRRAVAAAGVQPISSMENMTSEASDNNELQHAFDEEVLSSIRDRLNSDSDYRPEQFPNTDRYYHKNNKK
ncbi:large proline-rich protein BAG6-like isoform X1 [Argopecten irradians]|uniref:large proline-rich protein BAG6-like isoform X1 n=1 Tax=Argopecten irradians TaxID=31199 RepID=UPI0037131490